MARSKETIIIGKMNVVVKGNYTKVEFYIDDNLKYEDVSPPFQWEISPSIGKHEIRAKMYENNEAYEDKIHAFLFVLR
ncbi:MAG: hypothetical protein J7K47_06595 [Thermoplasmata archaeon]|nr:hypothetical protein [Thermoplasmata archaeon]